MPIVGRELVGILTDSFMVAARRGDRRVGTGFVLHAMLGRVPGGGSGIPQEISTIINAWKLEANEARLEESALSHDPLDGLSFEATSTLREIAWWRRGDSRHRVSPRWTSEVGVCLSEALSFAAENGVRRANPAHLLVALLSVRTAASTTLTAAGVDVERLLSTVRSHRVVTEEGDVYTPLVSMLQVMGCVPRRSGRLLGGLQAVLGWLMRKPYGPVLSCLGGEMSRLAARAGGGEVTANHALASILTIDQQLLQRGAVLRPKLQKSNVGGQILNEAGVQVEDALDLSSTRIEPEPSASPERLHPEVVHDGQNHFSPYVDDVLARAAGIARHHGHRTSGSLHLLASLVQGEPQGEVLLRFMDANVEQVRGGVRDALTAGA